MDNRVRQRLLPVLVLFLTACSMAEDVRLAESAVPHFHASLDAGHFGDLYDNAADELKAVTGRAEFVALLDAISRKLGRIADAEQTSWNVNYDTAGTFVTLVYDTAFTEGPATERFIFKLRDKRPLLVGYHINSNALVVGE